MKHLLLTLFTFSLFTQFANAQEEAKELIGAVNKKFALVKDYNADIKMKFALPGIKVNDINGKVYFKKPNKFKIRAKGIFFMPRDNPMKNIPELLAKTSSYTAIISGYSVVSGKKCAVVNVIPLDPDLELIIGKFWISVTDPLVFMSEITTKKNGTIRTQNFYGNNANQALPNKVMIQVEMKKFKIPKMLAMDVKKKSGGKDTGIKKTGEIYMVFHDYKVNTKFSNEVFTEN